jgi:hypothetical protein
MQAHVKQVSAAFSFTGAIAGYLYVITSFSISK